MILVLLRPSFSFYSCVPIPDMLDTLFSIHACLTFPCNTDFPAHLCPHAKLVFKMQIRPNKKISSNLCFCH